MSCFIHCFIPFMHRLKLKIKATGASFVLKYLDMSKTLMQSVSENGPIWSHISCFS